MPFSLFHLCHFTYDLLFQFTGLVSADKPHLSPETASSIVMEKSLDVLALGALVGLMAPAAE